MKSKNKININHKLSITVKYLQSKQAKILAIVLTIKKYHYEIISNLVVFIFSIFKFI